MTALVTRRDFLQHSSCLLAGTAAAAMLGRSAPAAEPGDPLTLACGDATLKNVQAADDLCLENESLGKLPEADRQAALAKEIQQLKQLTGVR